MVKLALEIQSIFVFLLGGVWMLIRRIEEKLSEDILGNLWQDSIIYGLIGTHSFSYLLAMLSLNY